MKKEKSCGAVIYKRENKDLKFLLVQHNAGHWAFPKGHVENDETEEETATREIKEETNVDVKIDTNFREVVNYSPKPGVIKDVVYFVAEIISDDEKPQLSEIQKLKWFSSDEVTEMITHNRDKIIFDKALIYLKGFN